MCGIVGDIGTQPAVAKGNTLLNFAGVRPDLLPFIGDVAPSKQDKYLPGSRIPIAEFDLRELFFEVMRP